MRLPKPSVRFWILTTTVLLNLGVAAHASAALADAVCKDPETGDLVHCCRWCVIFCQCSE